MPTIALDKHYLFQKIGRSFTDDEFDELCFTFGIELDNIVAESDGRTTYKIDVPANRCDLLCMEGISRSIRVFLKMDMSPRFTVIRPQTCCQIVVCSEVVPYRPYCVGAILRDITFTEVSFASFIDLQEKLHHNIGRKRSLVSVGAHDLDSVKGPFTYTAMKPEDISFQALTMDSVRSGLDIMAHYKHDPHIKSYLPIIEGFPMYPVVLDTNNHVLSLPPIINSYYSRLSVHSKAVFIEVTATDLNKAKIVLNTLVTSFSEYCKHPFTVEAVNVIYPDQTTQCCPDLSDTKFSVSCEWLNKGIGIKCSSQQYCELLPMMGLSAAVLPTEEESPDLLDVSVPAYRPDIIHNRDILEDAAIAYGFNNIPKTFPSIFTVASLTLLTRLSDVVRHELAQIGFTETMSFVLSCTADLMQRMNLDEAQVPECSLPVRFQSAYDINAVRNSLIPGILKTLSSNRKLPLPIKMFEVSDVVLQSNEHPNHARNDRRVCATYCSTTSGFELIHGMVDRLMLILGVQPAIAETGGNSSSFSSVYSLLAIEDPSFLPGRCCSIQLDGKPIGKMGIVHPNVLKNFELLPAVCSVFEFSLEPILPLYQP